jgi:ribosomal protein L10
MNSNVYELADLYMQTLRDRVAEAKADLARAESIPVQVFYVNSDSRLPSQRVVMARVALEVAEEQLMLAEIVQEDEDERHNEWLLTRGDR